MASSHSSSSSSSASVAVWVFGSLSLLVSVGLVIWLLRWIMKWRIKIGFVMIQAWRSSSMEDNLQLFCLVMSGLLVGVLVPVDVGLYMATATTSDRVNRLLPLHDLIIFGMFCLLYQCWLLRLLCTCIMEWRRQLELKHGWFDHVFEHSDHHDGRRCRSSQWKALLRWLVYNDYVVDLRMTEKLIGMFCLTGVFVYCSVILPVMACSVEKHLRQCGESQLWPLLSIVLLSVLIVLINWLEIDARILKSSAMTDQIHQTLTQSMCIFLCCMLINTVILFTSFSAASTSSSSSSSIWKSAAMVFTRVASISTISMLISYDYFVRNINRLYDSLAQSVLIGEYEQFHDFEGLRMDNVVNLQQRMLHDCVALLYCCRMAPGRVMGGEHGSVQHPATSISPLSATNSVVKSLSMNNLGLVTEVGRDFGGGGGGVGDRARSGSNIAMRLDRPSLQSNRSASISSRSTEYKTSMRRLADNALKKGGIALRRSWTIAQVMNDDFGLKCFMMAVKEMECLETVLFLLRVSRLKAMTEQCLVQCVHDYYSSNPDAFATLPSMSEYNLSIMNRGGSVDADGGDARGGGGDDDAGTGSRRPLAVVINRVATPRSMMMGKLDIGSALSASLGADHPPPHLRESNTFDTMLSGKEVELAIELNHEWSHRYSPLHTNSSGTHNYSGTLTATALDKTKTLTRSGMSATASGGRLHAHGHVRLPRLGSGASNPSALMKPPSHGVYLSTSDVYAHSIPIGYSGSMDLDEAWLEEATSGGSAASFDGTSSLKRKPRKMVMMRSKSVEVDEDEQEHGDEDGGAAARARERERIKYRQRHHHTDSERSSTPIVRFRSTPSAKSPRRPYFGATSSATPPLAPIMGGHDAIPSRPALKANGSIDRIIIEDVCSDIEVESEGGAHLSAPPTPLALTPAGRIVKTEEKADDMVAEFPSVDAAVEHEKSKEEEEREAKHTADGDEDGNEDGLVMLDSSPPSPVDIGVSVAVAKEAMKRKSDGEMMNNSVEIEDDEHDMVHEHVDIREVSREMMEMEKSRSSSKRDLIGEALQRTLSAETFGLGGDTSRTVKDCKLELTPADSNGTVSKMSRGHSLGVIGLPHHEMSRSRSLTLSEIMSSGSLGVGGMSIGSSGVMSAVESSINRATSLDRKRAVPDVLDHKHWLSEMAADSVVTLDELRDEVDSIYNEYLANKKERSSVNVSSAVQKETFHKSKELKKLAFALDEDDLEERLKILVLAFTLYDEAAHQIYKLLKKNILSEFTKTSYYYLMLLGMKPKQAEVAKTILRDELNLRVEDPEMSEKDDGLTS